MTMNFQRYESRSEAGIILTKFIEEKDNELFLDIKKNGSNYFCLCIPNGGVPVAEGFCSKLKIRYDLLIVRKMKIPYNPEAGFGSITTDGTVLINDSLVEYLNLTEMDINNATEQTKLEIEERLQFYNKSKNLSTQYQHNIESKVIFLIDDGLASGFTMLAAIKMVKKYNPMKVYVAVPTAPHRSIVKIDVKVDKVFCPNIKKTLRFAVASAYRNWYDLPESKVLEIIESSNYYRNR